MTARFVLSPKAQDDIEAIWNHSVSRWGNEQAGVYLRQIRDHITNIAARPLMGRARDDIRPGYRQIRAGSHLVFYRLTEHGIDVIRILHMHMDVTRWIDEE